MGIQINGNTNNINAGIGSLSIEDINELDIAGVATAANFKTGVSNLHSVGLSLSGGQIDVGSNIKIGNAGVITATSFVGSGANLTSLPAQVTLNNNADNRVITGGSGVNLYAESGFTYDGTIVQIPDRINLNTTGTYIKSNQIAFNPTGTAYLDHYRTGQDIQIRMSTSSSLDTTGPTFKSNGNLAFASGKGIDFGSNTSEGGTSTATVLEDYEEGSYTITSNANLTLDNTRTGYYTKVGNMVTVTGYLSLSTNNGSPSVSGSDNIVLSLPYAVNVSTGNYTGTMLQQNIDSDTPTSIGHPLYYRVLPVDIVCMGGSNGLRFYINHMELAWTRMNNSHLHVGYPGYTYIAWNITYRTN